MEIKIKEMYVEERPREKAIKYGVDKLSNRELLAMILRCGCKGRSVLQLADELIAKAGGINNLKKMSIDELCEVKGISKIKAVELMTCFELAQRSTFDNLKKQEVISDPQGVANYLMQKIGAKQQEHFVVLFLNTKHQIIAEETLFIGSLNTSVVHAREIFKAAIDHHSAKILIAHNHPSDDCIPSNQDIQVTDMITQTARIIGIPLLDHIIVGQTTYFSFKERQLMQ
ncbi:MAG: DNA repair protein RadC [Bacilli bacterium]|nr:DNA repair protein RadC [Bacilli bacterium]